jgi:hypothetical protein
MRTYLLLFTISACALYAEEAPVAPFAPSAPATTTIQKASTPGKNLWRASIVTLATANVMDVQSSWGKHELNSTLSGPTGTFGRQGALIKLGFQGGLVGLEYLITRGHPTGKLYRKLAFINFGATALIGGVAAHNYTVPRQ